VISHAEACALIETGPEGLEELVARAGEVRDRGRGRTVTFSAKVFVPLTTLCRDYCAYCTFRRDPGEPGARTLEPDEVVALAQAGGRLGAKEALLSLGDRRVGELLLAVHRFEGNWAQAFREVNLNANFYVYRRKETGEILPWDFIDHGVEKAFLASEYRKTIETTGGTDF